MDQIKNYFLFIIFTIGILGNVNAQQFKLGPLVGVNYSDFVGDLKGFSPALKPRIAYHVGIVSTFKLTNSISLSPRLMYSSQGFTDKIEVRENLETYLVKTNQGLNFLNIPLMVNFELNERFGLQAGPQIGFLINTTAVTTDNGGSSFEEGSKSTINEDFKLDYGARLALFYEVVENLQIELGYYRGFSNISRNGFINFSNNNSVFQLSLCYYLF
jgi:hypothetical protein